MKAGGHAFLTGRRPDGALLWACVDPDCSGRDPEIGERRFSAYVRPFTSEDDARAALVAAGAGTIELEQRPSKRRA
jgi:hypothetical protein